MVEKRIVLEPSLKLAFEAISAVVVVIDPASECVVYANRKAQHFYGYTAQEMEGMLYRVILRTPHSSVAALISKILVERELRFTLNHGLASGEVKAIETHASILSSGGYSYILTLSFDVLVKGKAERVLRNNLNIFQSFFRENSLPMVLVESHSLKVVEANTKAQVLLGIPTNRPKDKPFSDYSALEPHIFNKSIRNFFEKDFSGLELPFITKDSRVRDIDLHFTLVEVGREKLLLYILVDVTERNNAISALGKAKELLAQEVMSQTTDLVRINNSLIEQINRRKQVEEGLRQSEAMFFKLFQLNPNGTLLVDMATSTVAEVNQSFLTSMGFSKEQLLNKSINELPIFSKNTDIKSIGKSLFEGDTIRQVFAEVVTNEGNTRFMLFSAEIVCFERGTYMILVFQDITDIRAAQQRVEHSEKRFRTLIEHNTDIILIIDSMGNVIYYSPSVTKELSFNAPPGRMFNVLAFTHSEDRAPLYRVMNAMRHGEAMSCTESVRVRHGSGKYRTFAFTASNLLADPSVNGIIINAHDITDQIRAREEVSNALRQEQELSLHKTQFISTVSHEFRTPLANISLNIQLLRRYISQQKTELVCQNIKRMDHAVKKLTSLVNEASLISKDQGGRLVYSPEQIGTHELIDYLLDLYSYLLTPRIEVRMSKGECKRVLVDKNLISHVVGNLLGNAIKFSSERKTIIFSLKVLETKGLEIVVEDKGIGIPEDEIKFLFDPYYRATNIKRIGGTGLGLSIVKRCVDLHGGAISIASWEGEGTRVSCLIPLVQCP